MNLQGVHDSLDSAEEQVLHVEIVNDFDLAAEDFQQEARDSVSSLDASPEEENGATPSRQECGIKLTFYVDHPDYSCI